MLWGCVYIFNKVQSRSPVNFYSCVDSSFVSTSIKNSANWLKMSQRKCCIVPRCLSSDRTGQLMIAVPSHRRDAWMNAVMNARKYSSSYRLYCCENHFELQTDAENFMYYKEAGQRIKIRDEVVPHLALNSPFKQRTSQVTESAKKRKKLFQTRLEASRGHACEVVGEPNVIAENTERPISSESGSSKMVVSDEPHQTTRQNTTPTDGDANNEFTSRKRKQTLACLQDPDYEVFKSPSPPIRFSPSPELMASRDEEIAYRTSNHPQPPGQTTCRMDGTDEERRSLSSSPLAVALSTSPHLHNPALKRVKSLIRQSSSSSVDSASSITSLHTSFHPSAVSDTYSSSSVESLREFEMVAFKENSWKRESQVLFMETRMYLGLPKNHFKLIAFLEKQGRMSAKDIMIVFKKIRTNDSHKRLAIDFGCSESNVSLIFSSTICKLSSFLSHFIFWPSQYSIILKMPMQFRYRFSNVQSIIDGFEVEIEKPSSPKEQSLTWSEYKKCNTIKFLISCTPQGFINFLSRGYGGRISDCKLVAECGFLDVIPPNSDVLADRGFKQVEALFAKKNCKMIRPPSVSADEILSPEMVKWSKQISSVHIHVERVISRIREFKFLGIHAAVDIKLVPLLDHAVVIAGALINLQDPIIS